MATVVFWWICLTLWGETITSLLLSPRKTLVWSYTVVG